MIVYCAKCGKELPEDAYFCPKCGHKTPGGEEAGAAYPMFYRRRWGMGGHARYVVEESKSYSGPVTVEKVYLEVESINGPVRVSTWDKEEYGVELLIEASGYTEEEARQNLGELKIDLKDEIVEGRQRLALRMEPPHEDWRWYSVDVDVNLPAKAEADLDVGSKNGSVTLSELKGGKIRARTKNGRIELDDVSAGEIECRTSNGRMVYDDVKAESMKCRTSNGHIEGVVESGDADLSTSNGKIDLTLPCTTSGDYRLHTSNGRIELTVSSDPKVGYDLDLHTSMNRVDVDLPELEYSKYRRTRLAARTAGFSEREVKIKIEADTSMGRIKVHP
jgi:hypothetical protein